MAGGLVAGRQALRGAEHVADGGERADRHVGDRALVLADGLAAGARRFGVRIVLSDRDFEELPGGLGHRRSPAIGSARMSPYGTRGRKISYHNFNVMSIVLTSASLIIYKIKKRL